MPADTFYGSECEARIGIMADASTDPTAWHTFEFMSLTINPQRARKVRDKLGSPRNNPLDDIKPIAGFRRVMVDLVTDADSLQTPRLLRDLLGAPATGAAVSGIYPHVWASGAKVAALACLQLRTASGEVRVVRGLTLDALSVGVAGEQTQDFDLEWSLKGLTSERVADWLAGTVTAVPASSAIYRAVFRVDGAAATSTLDAQWAYSRSLVEDIFLSTTPDISALRPGKTGISGRARFRATAAAFDDLAEDDTVFAPDIQMLGVTAGHVIKFEHPHAQLNSPPLSVPGPDVIERTVDWFGFQDASTPGVRITVNNNVANYAT